VPPFRRA